MYKFKQKHHKTCIGQEKKKSKKHDTKVNHIVTNQDFLPKIFVLIYD